MFKVLVFSPDALFAEVISASLADDSSPMITRDTLRLVEETQRVRPDAVVAHLSPGDSIDVIAGVSSHAPLLVVGPDDERAMLAAVESGASGYALETDPLEGIVESVRLVATGKAVVPPMMLGSLLRAVVRRRRRRQVVEDRLAGLTPREREVFELVASGRNRKQIARDLIISPETVRTHTQRLMRKLDLHSQAEVVALGAWRGLDIKEDEE